MPELAWDGYPNCRDLGGLPSRFGRTREHRVARGPRRELLTVDGWANAAAWGLRSVVDLRCPDEVGVRPGDPLVPAGATSGIAVRQVPIEDHDNEEFRRVCFPVLDTPTYWPHHLRILPAMVRAGLKAIASAQPGVLIHCSAGRDRTGLISALLLGNAGVPAQLIADDYVASVRAMVGVASHSPTPDRQTDWDADEVNAWVRRTHQEVSEFAEETEAHLDALELGRPTRLRLRTLLIDP